LAVVEDRDDDALVAWQCPADLDLAITSIEPAVALDDRRDFAARPLAIWARSQNAASNLKQPLACC